MSQTHNMTFESIGASDDVISIRALTAADYDAFITGYKNQLSRQNEFDEGRIDTSFMSREWYGNLLGRRSQWAQDDVSYMLNIFRVSDGASVGFCDITTHMREEFQYARIGYTIFNQYWQSGYAKHMIRLLIAIGFEQLNFQRLEAYIDPKNELSKRVAMHGGMQLESTRKEFEYIDGVWRDRDVYVKRQKNWKTYEG